MKVIVSTARIHVRTARQPDRQTDSQADENSFLLVLSSETYKTWTFIKRREFFIYSCDYNTFSFYVLRMRWESNIYQVLGIIGSRDVNFRLLFHLYSICYFVQHPHQKCDFAGDSLRADECHRFLNRWRVGGWNLISTTSRKSEWQKRAWVPTQHRILQKDVKNIPNICLQLKYCRNIFSKYCKRFHRNIIILNLWNIFGKR